MSLAKVNDLKSRVGDLERKLSCAKYELAVARKEYNMGKLGLKDDSILVYRGKDYFFSRIADSDYSPWVFGNLVKKDGTRALNEVHLYSDWKIKS
jgi:hypothetical protein